jgi:hypothetical protein
MRFNLINLFFFKASDYTAKSDRLRGKIIINSVIYVSINKLNIKALNTMICLFNCYFFSSPFIC